MKTSLVLRTCKSDMTSRGGTNGLKPRTPYKYRDGQWVECERPNEDAYGVDPDFRF